MMRKLVTAAGTGLVVAAVSLSGTAFADTGPGASACQPAAGQQTATIAQALGGVGAVASVIATSQPRAIAALNQQDLFNCGSTP